MTQNKAQFPPPPPALTWTHLFAAGTAFDCRKSPEWFARLVAEYACSIPRSPDYIETLHADRVPILWEEDGAAPPRDDGIDGFVAVNCRTFSAAKARDQGFEYVRHYAVLPSLSNARWFVPLDSPAVSAAGLSLYTPARLSAKFKLAAARLAMHARLPLWYQDHLWIARRRRPPIEEAINPFFPDQDVRWALSSGAPVGAKNRKASALILAPDGRMLAFVKMAQSSIARRIAARETEVLGHLAQMPAMRDRVPSIIFSGEVDGCQVLAQTPLQGAPAPLAIAEAHQEFLAALRTPMTVRASYTSTVAALPDRLGALPTSQPRLLEILQQLLPVLEKFDVPMTVIHGDFAPWNLRVNQGRVAAFDWEYGELNGLPLLDEIHYRLQQGWLLKNWSTEQGLICIRLLSQMRPLDLEPLHAQTIAAVYLLDTLARLLGEGYEEEQDVIAWHWRLLEKLVLSFPHCERATAA